MPFETVSRESDSGRTVAGASASLVMSDLPCPKGLDTRATTNEQRRRGAPTPPVPTGPGGVGVHSEKSTARIDAAGRAVDGAARPRPSNGAD
jgi:hypothetical protein